MNQFLIRAASILGLCSLVVAGCSSKSNSGPVTPTAAPQMVQTGPPVTAEEAKQFGEALEKAVAAIDRPNAEKLFHMSELVDRSISDLNPPAAFVKGMKAGIAKGGTLSGQIITSVENGGSYKLLRVKTVNGSYRPLFRLLLPDSGVNYHEFELARYPDGHVGTADIHVAMTGEPITQTFRRFIIPALRDAQHGTLDRLAGRERLYFDNVQKITQITSAARTGQNTSAALATFRSLPAELQKEKVFQIMALQLAQNVSDDEYGKEMERFRATHPNDPAIDIISIDYLSLKKQFDKALECIDRLDRGVGGDPFLHNMRGNMYVLAEKWDEAKKSFLKALKEEPTLHDPHWGMVAVMIKQKNYDEAVVWLKKVVADAKQDVELDGFKTEELYRDFIKTPQFKAFETWYRERSKN